MDEAPLRRAFWQAYGTGLAVAVVWPLLLQAALFGWVKAPQPLLRGETLHQVGYAFTGLTLLGSVLLVVRFRALRRTLAAVPEALRAGRLRGELLLAAGLCAGTALLGLLYLVLGGPEALRHARGFLLLAPLQFLGLVPRMPAWRDAVRAWPGPTPRAILEAPQDEP